MSDSSGGITAIVAIIAIVVILGVGYFVMQNLSKAPDSNPTINVELPTGESR